MEDNLSLPLRRKEAFYNAIRWLNKNEDYRSHYYECGPDLGVLHVWWSGRHWRHEWVDIEEFPVAVA